MELPFPVADCWDLIDRAPLQVTCKVSVSLQMQMLREIASYLLKGKQCFASDDHFATKFRVSIAQIKNAYRALREQGVVHFVEQPRAGIRGRGSRAKLKVIDWGQLSLMVDQRANQHADQRLTSDRPTANQHADQRLTSDRPTANQHTDQRLTISRNSLVNTKEDQQTTDQPVVVSLFEDGVEEDDWLCQDNVTDDDWNATQQRLDDYKIKHHSSAIAAAKSHGWHPSQVDRLIDQAKRMGSPPSHLYNWIVDDSAPPEPIQELIHDIRSLPWQAQNDGFFIMERTKGWPHFQRQAAIDSFESQWRKTVARGIDPNEIRELIKSESLKQKVLV